MPDNLLGKNVKYQKHFVDNHDDKNLKEIHFYYHTNILPRKFQTCKT